MASAMIILNKTSLFYVIIVLTLEIVLGSKIILANEAVEQLCAT